MMVKSGLLNGLFLGLCFVLLDGRTAYSNDLCSPASPMKTLENYIRSFQGIASGKSSCSQLPDFSKIGPQCGKPAEKAYDVLKECLDTSQFAELRRGILTALKREHLKQTFEREIEYASRFSSDTEAYHEVWAVLKKRWSERLAKYPWLRWNDHDPMLKAETLGEIGILVRALDTYKEGSGKVVLEGGTSNGFPRATGYDLLRAVLVLDALNTPEAEGWARATGAKTENEPKALLESERTFILNVNPELQRDKGLRKDISKFLKKHFDARVIARLLYATEGQTEGELLASRFAKVSRWLSKMIPFEQNRAAILGFEKRFAKAHFALMREAEREVEKTIENPLPLLERPEIIGSAIASMDPEKSNLKKEAMSVFYCHAASQAAVVQKTLKGVAFAGAAVLGVSGIAALGAGGVALTAMIMGSKAIAASAGGVAMGALAVGNAGIIASTPADLYLRIKDYNDTKNLIYLKLAKPERIAEASARKNEAVFWGSINLLAGTTAALTRPIQGAAMMAHARNEIDASKRLDSILKTARWTDKGLMITGTAGVVYRFDEKR
ncbi:MAG TPA: hypothetical protein VJB59_12655 [Bdellovibrionota bacterium]|nr:hypothetical protein [Bdellovibrionota bacterium]